MEFGHTLPQPEPDREAMAARRYGALDAIPNLDNDIWCEYQDVVVADGRARGFAVKPLHVEAGDSLIWHPQLPHGGTPIRDAKRTRFSRVTHNTPFGVPVYQQNVFVAPGTPFPESPSWDYRAAEGRQLVNQSHGVSFGHERNVALVAFKRAA